MASGREVRFLCGATGSARDGPKPRVDDLARGQERLELAHAEEALALLGAIVDSQVDGRLLVDKVAREGRVTGSFGRQSSERRYSVW